MIVYFMKMFEFSFLIIIIKECKFKTFKMAMGTTTIIDIPVSMAVLTVQYVRYF